MWRAVVIWLIKERQIVNKMELVAAVAASTGLSKGQAEEAVSATLGSVTDALKKGDDVNLVGFGRFYVQARDAQEGRNPQTGAKIQIPASKLPKFKAGKGLKDAVN